MTLELGVYSFGNTPRNPDGGYGPTAAAVRAALEGARLAEDVGLDFVGFGEHHTASMPLSSPTSLVTAAAASTERIKLGTTVTVLPPAPPPAFLHGDLWSGNILVRSAERRVGKEGGRTVRSRWSPIY